MQLETPILLARRSRAEILEDLRAVRFPLESDAGNDHVQPLDSMGHVSDYWDVAPPPKHLHVLVQKPGGASPNMTYKCLTLTIFLSIPAIASVHYSLCHRSLPILRSRFCSGGKAR